MNLFRRYHSYLVAKTESAAPRTRYFLVSEICWPWLLPLFPMALICWAFNLDDFWRGVVVLSVGVVSLGGFAYAGFVILVYGIKADLRRIREAKVTPRQPR